MEIGPRPRPQDANPGDRFGVLCLMKRVRRWMVGIGIVSAIGLGFLGLHGLDRGSPTPSTPSVLQKVQALSDLRTARYTYQRVFTHETAREPQAWLAVLPGGADLVTAATRNEALLSVQGEVEAGVDLGQARLEKGPEGPTILLPPARVYPVQVTGRVHRHRPGMFWRDDNVALSAVGAARAEFRRAALSQGIVERAEQEAVRRVESLLSQAGSPIKVRVDRDGQG